MATLISETLALEASGVSKRFGKVEALRDISLKVRQGEIFGLIGPDGAGNTQIMYDQYRRVKAESGNISSDTGAAASDDRQTSLEFHLNGVNYPNLYVEDPTEGGWESLLALAVSSI